QAHAFEHRAHPLADLGAAGAPQDQRQGHVLADGAVGQQAVVLVDHADLAPVQGDLAATHALQVALAQQHRAAGGAFGQVDELEQGALAGAGMAGDEQHLALVHAEADIDQRLVPPGVLLGDVFESQDGHAAIMRGCARRSDRDGDGRQESWLQTHVSTDVAATTGDTGCSEAPPTRGDGSAADQRTQLAADAAQQGLALELQGLHGTTYRRGRLADHRHRGRIGLVAGLHRTVDRLAATAATALARGALALAGHGRDLVALDRRLLARRALRRGRLGLASGGGSSGLDLRLAARTTLAALAALATAALLVGGALLARLAEDLADALLLALFRGLAFRTHALRARQRGQQ